jgi:run domain Beclin-1 interacting cysteine-rich containing protein
MNCILTLETKDLKHLAKIDKILYEPNTIHNKLGHRRSISQPPLNIVPHKSILSTSHNKKNSRSFKNSNNNNNIISMKEKVKVLRRCKSAPNLNHESLDNRARAKTLNAYAYDNSRLQKKVSFKSDEEDDVPFFHYNKINNNNASTSTLESSSSPSLQKLPVPIHLVKVDDIPIYTDYRFSKEYKLAISPASSNSSSKSFLTPKRSFFSFFESPSDASKLKAYKEECEEPSFTSTSPSEIFFTESVVAGSKIRSKSTIEAPNFSQSSTNNASGKKRKSSRQNLANFIHLLHNSRIQKVELERENAHFHLSEAIIAHCEQLKWNKMFDEKFKIPKDCRIKQSLSHSIHKPFQHPPPKIRSNTKFTIGSVEDDTESSLSSDELSANDKRKLSTSSSDDMCENTPQMEWNSSFDIHSAESIALSLISKFKNQPLPSSSHFMWLVNESQTPQELLPLPSENTIPINPDDALPFNSIRGSNFFAPPRPQIIFTIHPAPDRKRIMFQQNNRCAGCGIKIAPAYIHKLRYCDYIGKYFCTACHKMQVSTIPARVLNKWDFALHPVSNFAYKWLDQIWSLPLFHVSDLNPKLYQKAKNLSNAREARLQLKYVAQFINQCRFADKERDIIKASPSHWIDDVDIWSMTDFVAVKNSTYSSTIQEIISKCEEHIIKNNCEVSD